MKIINYIFVLFFLVTNGIDCFCQSIPFGSSIDTVIFIGTNKYCGKDTIHYQICYYKPLNYDSLTSPILLGIHGSGGNGNSAIASLLVIANNRKALIVAPTLNSWNSQNGIDGTNEVAQPCGFGCNNLYWYPEIFKQVYKHVINRMHRDSVPVHFIGFSAGGQFVTRYMLIRQVVIDSIPIKMAVSSNPHYYTFCTEFIDTVPMPYPCGISYYFSTDMPRYAECDSACLPIPPGGPVPETHFVPFIYGLPNHICNEHVVQYYNENYAVLIGNADTLVNGGGCAVTQGINRYERAKNFYHFSDSNAVIRETTLKWQYGEVPDVGHDEYLMYNTILSGDSISLAERLLFETPYHTVPSLAPIASFSADTTIVQLTDATVNFINTSINSTSYKWSFGDGDSSIIDNPVHTYSYADTFKVSLSAYNSNSCKNKTSKCNYIIVKNPVSTNDISFSKYYSVYPNPTNKNLTISSKVNQSFIVAIYNSNGQLFLQEKFQGNEAIIDMSTYLQGIYFLKIITEKNIVIKKIVKE